MVAVIHSGKSLRGALNYNEQKVKRHKAACLTAANYPKEVQDLTVYQKLSRLTNQAALNQRAQVNCVHISLNFSPQDKIAVSHLQAIAKDYMEQIGFGQQPYLVYQHHDAGHLHLHIVTTNIKADGKRIELHNLGRNQSEQARKNIEDKYGLVKASSQSIGEAIKIPIVNAQKVQYGKSETKRAITSVLDKVINQYKYTSLTELNAVLELYNVRAERGKEDSMTHKKGGLLYRVLDEQGHAVGVPIKSSSIYNKPTLKVLNERFIINAEERKPHKQRIKTVVDWSLFNRQLTLPQFIAAAKREAVQVVVRQNRDGVRYGITYIDHKTKSVYNGSDLGKEYSIKAITEKCLSENITHSQPLQHTPRVTESVKQQGIENVAAQLLQPAQNDGTPGEIRDDRKKKKRKRIRL